MNDYSLGTLEETILIILLIQERCHGVEIAKVYEEHMNQGISLPAIHIVLKRMEKKGWVKSEFGEPTAERGGRRKRIYWATPTAYQLVDELNKVKTQLWSGATKPTLNYVLG